MGQISNHERIKQANAWSDGRRSVVSGPISNDYTGMTQRQSPVYQERPLSTPIPNTTTDPSNLGTKS